MKSFGMSNSFIVGFVALYALLANARQQHTEVFVSLDIAASIVVVVLAGIVLGWKGGFLTGLFGSLIHVMSPSGSFIVVFTLVPVVASGVLSGLLYARTKSSLLACLSIPFGYVLLGVSLVSSGVLPFHFLFSADFLELFVRNSVYAAVAVIVVFKLLELIQQPVSSPSSSRRRQVTLEIGVWKILAVIALLLTGLFVVFFSFPLISITLVMGGALLMLADKLRVDFELWASEKKISSSTKRLYGYALGVFWTVIAAIIIFVAISNVAGAVTDLGRTEASQYVDSISPYLPDFLMDNFLTERNVRQAESAVFSILAQVLTNATTFMLIAVILIPLMFITYFRQRREIVDNFSQIVPEKIRSSVMEMVSRVSKQLKAFVSAKLIESLVVGAICVVGFYIAGIQGFLILGLLAGFLNIIPYVGPFLGAIPALLLAMTQAPVAALIVLVTVVVAQLVDNMYLQPFMIADQVQINPLVAVLVTFIGAQALGIMGMVFAIPVYLVYKLVLGESHRIMVEFSK